MKNIPSFDSFINESLYADDTINESAAIPATMSDEELSKIMPDKKDLERKICNGWVVLSMVTELLTQVKQELN